MAQRIDHTMCTHERTPKARAACRARQQKFNATMTALREAKTPEMDEATNPCHVTLSGEPCVRTTHGPNLNHLTAAGTSFTTKEAARAARAAQSAADKARGRIERRRAKDPVARLADRRGAEIRASLAGGEPSADGKDYSHCVQAVLHRGGGRCACGWRAE